jgi:hypothetical protein
MTRPDILQHSSRRLVRRVPGFCGVPDLFDGFAHKSPHPWVVVRQLGKNGAQGVLVTGVDMDLPDEAKALFFSRKV